MRIIDTIGATKVIFGTGIAKKQFNTEKFITSVNTEKFGGFSGWRIPTVKELSSLFYSGLSPYVDWIYLKPVKAYYPCWSSSLAADHNYSWYVHFGDKDNILLFIFSWHEEF
ncbi:MAG: Lcl C-terminal domain-containing protein [Candidatus Electronema sp. VV]